MADGRRQTDQTTDGRRSMTVNHRDATDDESSSHARPAGHPRCPSRHAGAGAAACRRAPPRSPTSTTRSRSRPSRASSAASTSRCRSPRRERDPVLLSLPVWTPGDYEVSYFARNVSQFAATSRGQGAHVGQGRPEHLADRHRTTAARSPWSSTTRPTRSTTRRAGRATTSCSSTGRTCSCIPRDGRWISRRP